MKQTIAVDIDDVLSRSAEGFIAFSNQQWGMKLRLEEYQEEWTVVWGVDLHEAMRRSVEFHSSGVVSGYEPYESAASTLKRLSKHFNLIAVTSRREILGPETNAWMTRHFPHIFQGLQYTGIWDRELTISSVPSALSRTKADLCLEFGAEYLIDDQPKHCIGAAKSGVKALLFGDYAWGRVKGDLPPRVTRARNWQEVGEYFNV